MLFGNDEWLYVTDCSYSVNALIRLEQEGDVVMVDAPYQLSLEDALLQEEDLPR